MCTDLPMHKFETDERMAQDKIVWFGKSQLTHLPNPSCKVPAALGWAAAAVDNRSLREFDYVLKVDDDVFVNTGELLADLIAIEAGNGPMELLYLGTKWSGSSPHRDPTSKHFVQREAYVPA